ncbi:hypothetical protein JG688_00010958, partial [Phytophthora aleatoria]
LSASRILAFTIDFGGFVAGWKWGQRQLVVALTLAWSLLSKAAHADCAAGASTLTTEGCSGCREYDLCLGFSSASECFGSGCETDGDWTFQCMSVKPNLSTLVVLIEFGGYKSSKEVAAGGFTLSGYPDLTSEWPSATNDDVTAVSTIDLSSAVTTFIMSGGTADVEYPQGKVASVTLTSDFISSASAMTKVVLQNLDLNDEIDSLPALLPSTVESLDLGNTLLLDYNYITTVDSLDVIDSIITLSIESNSLTTFSGVFINLEYLYLGTNNFTSVPTAIFSHSNLKTLNLTGNSFTSRSFTKDQAEFLNNLESLVLTASDFTVGLDCDDMDQVVIHDVTVCLSDVVATSASSSADAAPLRKKPHTFLSIWSDPELLSLQVRVEDIEDVKQLGSGAFATVWLVRYRKSQLLASKRLRPERRTKKHTSNFVEEIKLIAHFDHPNLVKLIGAAWTIESDLQALLEFMDGGDLRQYLADASTPFGWSFRKFDIAIGIIEALVYLHSFVPPLVHRDLKSKNVLLSSDFQVKLSDFGTSRFRSVENTMTAGVGTGRWLAPEVIRGDTDYGCSADIYSFGALLTELDTNQIPYSNARGSNGKILTDMTILHHVATVRRQSHLRWRMTATLRSQCLAALGLVLLLITIPNFVRGECASGSSTLTTEGCSGCGAYDLCLGFTSDDECSGSGCETDGDCTYQCMTVDGNLTTLEVLIDFGGFKSAQETAMGGYTAADLAGYPDFTDTWPSASNDDVTAVGTIDLSDAVETFIMSGGTAAVNYPQGKVSSVTLTSDFISSATAVTRVVLQNLGLSDQADDLPGFLPSTVKNLELTNTLLAKFPANLGKIAALEQLLLDYNYITAVDTLDVIDSITTLSLERNSIKTFTGVFANLEYLFLGENNLTSIPTAIYKHSYLKTLYVDNSVVLQKNAARRKLDDSFGFTGTRFPSIDSDLVLQQPYGGLRTSAVFGMDIPMTSTEFSMANRTAGGDEEGSMGIPMSVDGSMGIPTSNQGTSAYPSSMPTVEAGDRNPDRFMSIWNDPDLLSLQVRAADVKDIKQLGSGAFAMVWLVRYRDLQMLASKRLRPERRTKKHTAMFIEEIKLIAQFDHPNLVNFVGAAWTIESDLQMLLEYMDGGDLRRYLADPQTPVGWTKRKFDIAIGVIEALVYLHSFVPPLVHRDLKSKNVLLSSDFKAKLSDFGASRFRSVENTMTGGVGTGRWLAPEVIRGDTDYGSAADIYSFGALLTELDTNKIPYINARGSNGKILSDMTILHRVATGKLHPEVGSDCSPALKDLVERCLVEDQSKRPAATVIAAGSNVAMLVALNGIASSYRPQLAAHPFKNHALRTRLRPLIWGHVVVSALMLLALQQD